MSLLVVGLSHRTATVPLLEQVVLDGEGRAKLLTDLRTAAAVSESAVLSTCNRVEIYADVTKFHAGLADLTAALATRTGLSEDLLHPHLYVHYEDRAVQHLFEVAAGLDSMVVGETQILGQVRAALVEAQQADALGRVLNDVMQRALRAGKRAHTETAIGQAGASVVAAGLQLAGGHLGELADRSALVIGAGSMGALAAHRLQRAGATLRITSRSTDSAERLADAVAGTAVPLDTLGDALAGADLVVSCTGATGFVVDADTVARAATDGRQRVMLDLALPRDIDPAVLSLPDVTLIDMDDLGRLLADSEVADAVDGVRTIVAEEIAATLERQRSAAVAPVVVALRDRAETVIAAELSRLDGRAGDLDPVHRAEVEQAVRRVVDKLLHTPTVRVKELAATPPSGSYAEALHALFDLDPAVVEAITDVPEAGR